MVQKWVLLAPALQVETRDFEPEKSGACRPIENSGIILENCSSKFAAYKSEKNILYVICYILKQLTIAYDFIIQTASTSMFFRVHDETFTASHS